MEPPFNFKGAPDFNRYLHAAKGVKSKVKVKFTGDTKKDFALADKASGLKPGYRSNNKLTWHHAENDTMLLIPRKIHEAVKHTGGSAIKRETLR